MISVLTEYINKNADFKQEKEDQNKELEAKIISQKDSKLSQD